jgi:exonuclease III
MKIVSWNCNGALRKKLDVLDELDADVYIIQECENPKESTKKYQSWAGDYLWIGKNKNKGIGIFPKKQSTVKKLNWNSEYSIKGLKSKNTSLSWRTKDLELFLPFELNSQFNMLAVWTKRANSETFGYMGQFWKYLQIHRKELSKPNTIICGDFNSNAIWDRPDRWWNHSDVIQELSEIGLHSAYHFLNDEEQGKESTPTFYMRRNVDSPYHIDYVFTQNNIIQKVEINVGSKDKWLELSDHLPLTIKF